MDSAPCWNVVATMRRPEAEQHQSGLILNISSGAGVFTLPMISLYCASKFALERFSEVLSYVATDDIAPMVQARRETSESAYRALMRSRFTANAQ